jgi:solute carrier family 25 iron transporter 28/37
MTDTVQINTLDDELEWEEWRGVRRLENLDILLIGYTILEACRCRKRSGDHGTRCDVSFGYCEGMIVLFRHKYIMKQTRMQAFTGSASAPRIGEVVSTLLKESGPMGLIRGWNVIASGCVPAHIALFTVYESMKDRLSSKVDGSLSSHHAAICGVAATAAHDCILTPMDVVKQRLQLGCYEGAMDCTRSVIRTEGVWALFRSYPTTLAINAPYGAVLVAANEKLKSWLIPAEQQSLPKQELLPRYFLSAGLAAACASMLTHPLDVVKTRLQTQDCFCKEPPVTCPRRLAAMPQAPVIAKPKYSDFITSVRLIHLEEGFRGFYRGLIPRAALSVPGAAMCWGTYESVKAFLGNL